MAEVKHFKDLQTTKSSVSKVAEKFQMTFQACDAKSNNASLHLILALLSILLIFHCINQHENSNIHSQIIHSQKEVESKRRKPSNKN